MNLDQAAQRISGFTSSITSIFIFLALIGSVFAIMGAIRAYNRGDIDESQKQRSILTGILVMVIMILLAIVIKIVLVGTDEASASSSSFSKYSLDFNYEEFKKYLSAYWGCGKVVIIFITFYYIARFIYLYRTSKDSYKMFKSYVGIVNKYFIKGRPIQDNHVKAFVVDNELTNPLDPELWNKNAAKYFTERIL